MANQRNRHRVVADSSGTGTVPRNGTEFQFRVTDFSVAGIQLEITDGGTPTISERVVLEFVPERLDGFDTPVRVKGIVRRITRHGGNDWCGIELEAVRRPQDGDALDDAYLEHFLIQHT